MDPINLTKLQESLHDFYRFYNLSFALSIATCPSLESHWVKSKISVGIDEPILKETDWNPLKSLAGLFYFFHEDGDKSSSSVQDEGGNEKLGCISVLDVTLDKKFSTYFDVCLLLTITSFLIWFVLCLVKCILRKIVSRSAKNQAFIVKENEKEDDKKDVMESSLSKFKSFCENDIEPVRISFPFEANNDSVKSNIDQIFESTLQPFLKKIDLFLGFEIQQFIDERNAKHPSSTFSDTTLQSPRIRRKWSCPQDITPSIIRNSYSNEKNLQNWMLFETVCKRLNWLPPKNLENNFYHARLKDKYEKLNVLLNFLRQNCVSKLADWNVGVMIVNYSLFLLDQIVKHSFENDKSNDPLRLIRFESIGSAADGSVIGKPDHFDVMFIFEFQQSTDLNIIHNNYCSDIPPGYVVLGVNNVDNKNILKTNNCLYKAQIQDKFGFYLLANQIEDIVDGMVRKAVRKLNTSHKYKMERLPFKLSLNSSKKLELIIDTSFFNGMGMELLNISVKIMPSVCIESPEFGVLPKLYAVPTSRADHRKNWDEKVKGDRALSKLFPRSNNSHLLSNLLWNISVTKLEVAIRRNKEDCLLRSNTESCHVECLMVLKSLFCSKNKSSLLSKGEITSYVLSTVVNFLLMESSSSAWKMSNLGDRVSDAVHFLRSAYTNVWLPNFVIHNPHLAKKIPPLHLFSSLLKGRQQNLLADVDANAALKTVTFLESRLKETGLSKIINDEYSDEMWEYEFFLFG